MGKGFNNYMSKKDFHPSAIWNLKRVYEAEEKLKMEKKKQEELRRQYEKEQDIINNKALLGDEKAKIGLAFMYDPPAGIRKEEKTIDPANEPKFEWQRKYNAPREAWAKGDENVQDQPFGIQVRNVRCVKCHTWGHINTDRECPLYNMSGNKEDPGFSTNPSDLIRELRKSKGESTISSAEAKEKKERMNPHELVTDMRTEYGLTLKKHVLEQVRSDDALEKLGRKPDTASKSAASTSSGGDSQQQLMFDYLKSLSDKERTKIFKKFFESETKEKKSKSDKKKHRKRHDTTTDDDSDHSPSPPPKKKYRSDRSPDERRSERSRRHDRDRDQKRKIVVKEEKQSPTRKDSRYDGPSTSKVRDSVQDRRRKHDSTSSGDRSPPIKKREHGGRRSRSPVKEKDHHRDRHHSKRSSRDEESRKKSRR